MEFIGKLKIKNVFQVKGKELDPNWKNDMYLIIADKRDSDTKFYISTLPGLERSGRNFNEWETKHDILITKVDFKNYIGEEIQNLIKSKGTKGYYWLNKFESKK